MTIDISRVKALCFDLDGTLSDTDDLFVLALAEKLQPLSFLFRDKDPRPFARRIVMFTEAPGNFLLGIPDQLGFDYQLSQLSDRLYQKGIGKHAKPFLLIDGVGEMLARLSKDFPLSIVSARGERSALRFLDQFQLREHFQAIACAQTCEHTKPYPDPIHWAARQMGVRADECLMIGDTTVDVKAGKAAGAQTVAVLCGFGEEKELTQAGADLILSHTSDLLKYFYPVSP